MTKLKLVSDRHEGTQKAIDKTRDMIMPVSTKPRQGLTSRQEAFCQAVAEGGTLSAAYRACYSTDNMKPETVHNQASKLVAKPHVGARINQILSERESGYLHERVRLRNLVISGLEAIATDPTISASARVSALTRLGQIDEVQLFKADTMKEDRDRSPEEIRKELISRLVKAQAAKSKSGR